MLFISNYFACSFGGLHFTSARTIEYNHIKGNDGEFETYSTADTPYSPGAGTHAHIPASSARPCDGGRVPAVLAVATSPLPLLKCPVGGGGERVSSWLVAVVMRFPESGFLLSRLNSFFPVIYSRLPSFRSSS